MRQANTRETTFLDQDDIDDFLQALEAPAAPTSALLGAVRRHRSMIDEGRLVVKGDESTA